MREIVLYTNSTKENKHFKRYQVYQAFKDPKIYLLFIHTLGSQIAGGLLTSFRSQVISFIVSFL